MSAEVHTLSNGVRVVVEPMAGLGSASLGVWVGAGCRNETAAENGVAHFLEHMAFKGTRRRSALQIAEEIETVGGYLNAYTSRETTAYYARVLSEDAPLAMDVIADILREPLFDEAEIEVERGVILQEIGQAHDTPDDIIFDWLQEAAYPDQPMGRPILGPAERVRAFDRGAFTTFTAAHYRPENLIVSAAGGVDPGSVLALAEKLFGDMAPAPAAEVAPARYAGAMRREIKALEQAHVAIAFEGAATRSEDRYAMQVLATALGGGMSSRLFQEAREKRGLCYTIFANASSWSDSGLVTVYAGTGGEEARGLVELIGDEMRRAAETLDEVEVARARAQMKAGLVMGLESPSSRSERNARSVAIWGRTQNMSETVARIEAVDARAARDWCAGLISAKAPALAYYGPVADAPDAEAFAARLAG